MLRNGLLLVALAFPLVGLSAESVHTGDLQKPESPYRDSLNRDTPRGTVQGFLQAIDSEDLPRAARYLDLRNLPSDLARYSPEQLAQGLALVLQRGPWIDLEGLSDEEAGEIDDGLPSYRDLLVWLDTPDGSIPILLQRVPDGEGGRIWKFSNATIARLGTLYETYRYNDVVEWLAKVLPDTTFLGFEIFKWVTLAIVLVIATPVLLLVTSLLARWLAPPGRAITQPLRRFLRGPVTVFVLVVIAGQTAEQLGTGLTARRILETKTLLTAAGIWLLWQAFNLVRDAYGQRLEAQGRGASLAIIRPLRLDHGDGGGGESAHNAHPHSR